MLSVALPDSTLIEYVIDALGRRVAKKVGGTLVRQWTYQDQLNPIAEYDGSGNLIQRFVYATRMNVPDLIIRGGTTYRVIADQVGSVRRIVEVSTGAVVQELTYSPFGKVLGDSSPGWQPFAYAGGLYDIHTKLVRFGARDYDAEVGRWTTKDPIGFAGGPNHYAYAGSDPIDLIDPTGLLFGLFDAGEGAGESAAMYWADRYNESSGLDAAGAAVMGTFASLWTPETSSYTATTLLGAGVIAAGARMAGLGVASTGAKAGGRAAASGQPSMTLYHGGRLSGGTVQGGRFSTTTCSQHAAEYAKAAGGQVHKFRVPVKRLHDMEGAGKLQRFKDLHQPSGS